MDNKEELIKCLEEKINMGKKAVERLNNMEKVEGVEKLVRKFMQEIRFLEKVSFLISNFCLSYHFVYPSSFVCGFL